VQVRQGDHGVTVPLGYRAGAVACGIKDGSEKQDLGVIVSAEPAAAAAVFTQNRAAAAPIHLDRERIKSHRVSAIVANSGNANASTGPQGLRDAIAMGALISERFAAPADDVLVFSTGVIGIPMPMDRVEAGIARVEVSADGGQDFARAIMTTDTRMKSCSIGLEIDGVTMHIGGAAKGSGMIHPNMATLLGFLTTDARVEPGFLQASLAAAVERSFNMISVDGDTSTNDAVVLLANGAVGGAYLHAMHPAAAVFADALTTLCVDLAKQLAADGEGARTLVEIQVAGARSVHDAREIARSISRSNLVKTAVFGGDPNWGRIICAAGYAGCDFDPDLATLFLNDVRIYDKGLGLPYSREVTSAMLKAPEVIVRLDLGLGDGSATAWGCDMSYDYVRINAEYTT
jgi:glutamate N-acetyltransferase/amino-acid N-acetyltransferase